MNRFDVKEIKALVFDVFGTVVDWLSSVAAEVEAFATRHGLHIDAFRFADAWRASDAARVMSSYDEFVHEPTRAELISSGQPSALACSSTPSVVS